MGSSCGIAVDLVADWVYGEWGAAKVHVFICRHVFLLTSVISFTNKKRWAMPSDTLESRSTREILVGDIHFVTCEQS
jgi:hypothetical protein